VSVIQKELLSFVLVAFGGGGAAQVRLGEVLPSLGILRGGMPAPAFTSQMRPQRNTFHWFLEICFR